MDQSNFNFTNAKRAYEVKFYALPQILLQGEKYKDLSDSAILLYSVLRDRLSYSLSNNWVDENNNVYFIYTNNELKDLRNWSNNKINKIKHELMDANLLYQKHMGFNPNDDELKPLMTKALRRYFNALRSNEKHIKNVENYLYGTMQNLFGVWWNKQAAREYAAKHPEEQNADNERF
ncbi:replication initiator protein A [Lactiplantibacillus sp. ME-2]|uniref:replication initiator protein A n=1 Tax=Lactiplantibacillus sp. ME-2 TaxID=2923377 RepID=UPI001F4A9281|nr:replication initiator protein A [Lactiplantibacillus sp. ME-2]MCH7260435.1 replication initiator protein A [Lactiplantibacillus sp. ME-2]